MHGLTLPYFLDTPEARAGFRRRIIPRGTILFRAADSLLDVMPDKIAQHFNVCTDTHKRGLYFATYPFLSMAIATEYHRDMLLGVFEVQQDIVAADEKYKFRSLVFPPNGPQDMEEFESIHKLDPLPEEFNINHFDGDMLPILKADGSEVNELPRQFSPEGWAGELFVAKAEDRAKVKLVDAYIVRHAKVPEIARELEYAVYADHWESAQDWLNFLEHSEDFSGVRPPAAAPPLGELKAGAIMTAKKRKTLPQQPMQRTGTSATSGTTKRASSPRRYSVRRTTLPKSRKAAAGR